MKKSFQVGDTVISCNRHGYLKTGRVVKISEKRGDIIVDFGNYKSVYRANGDNKSDDVWYRTWIKLLTPEIKIEIAEKDIIQRCYDTFSWVKDNGKLTAAQAVKILEILKEDDVDENTDRMDTD